MDRLTLTGSGARRTAPSARVTAGDERARTAVFTVCVRVTVGHDEQETEGFIACAGRTR